MSRNTFAIGLFLVLALARLSAIGTPVALAAGYVVTKTADTNDGVCDADCSLREAINAANALAGADTITFDIPDTDPGCLSANVCTITLTGALPVISDDVTIDGAPNGGDITVDGDELYRPFEINAGKTVTLDTLTIIKGKVVDANGGGIFNAGTLHVLNSTLDSNQAVRVGSNGYGGGIYNASGAVLEVVNSTLGNNRSIVGGAIDNYSTLTVTASIFSSNATSSGGGALRLQTNTSTTISDSTFVSNTTTTDGGAILDYGTATIRGSTFSGNSANLGGAINNNLVQLSVINSTFFNNSAAAGAALYNLSPATAVVLNSTFSTNTASQGGGVATNGSVTLYNAIVANSTGGGCYVAIPGHITADAYNLDTDGTCDNATQKTVGEINLQPLANHGGSTQTMALLLPSAAVDTGDNTVCDDAPPGPDNLDQRGVIRPQNTICDVGAFESLQCPIGRYDDGGVCTAAPKGYYVDTIGSLASTPCPPGYFQPNTGAATCNQATAGYFVPYTASISQTPCPSGSNSAAAAIVCFQTGPNFVVNDAADTDDSACDALPGNCTLREAINAANNLSGADSITFDISDDVGTLCSSNNVCIIALGSSLPNVTDEVTIDGAPNNGDITVSGSDSVRILQLINNKTLNLNALTIADGFASSSGAGLYVNGGATLNVTNSTFSGNSISTSILQSGGAAIINVAGTVRITNSTFNDNSFTVPVNCGPCGGTAILNLSGTLEVTNSTFSGNTFTSPGTCNPSCGGAIRSNGGTTSVTNSTFSGNLVSGNGHAGAFSVESGTVTLRNSIISGSTPVDCYIGGGTFNADAFNIDSDGSCGSATTKTTTEIALGALADNGGPTQTMALANNSVAIDAGDNSVCEDNPGPNNLDQRGFARNDLQCDVGAFEFVITDGNTVAKSNLSSGQVYTFGPTLAGVTAGSFFSPPLTIQRDLVAPVNSPPANALPITWDATTTGSGYSFLITLCYDPSVLTGQNESALHVWHYNGSIWDDLGGTPDDTTHLPYHCVTAATPLTSLSPLAVAPAATTAVNVTGPSARVNPKGKVVVRWRTTNESQIAGFNIYRRTDKGEWKQINKNFKQAKHAGAAQGASYRFTNREVKSDKTFRYKVQIVYLDNHTEWTVVVKVKP